MFVYDLRFQKSSGYSGHTMPILKKGTTKKGETGYLVAEGHTSTTPGEGTKIERKIYTEKEIKDKFVNPKDNIGEPGLRDYRKSQDYKMLEPGPREWNWKQF